MTPQQENPIVYSQVELDIMRKVRSKLSEEHGIEENRVGSRFLAFATITCKLRTDETVEKIKKLLDIMEKLDCSTGLMDDGDLFYPESISHLNCFAVCGTDSGGCSIVWINGGMKVPKEEERIHVQASLMWSMAVHADSNTLRNGYTFIIDFSVSPPPPKIGNERVISGFHRCIPGRPKSIMISGTNYISRIAINLAIRVTSLFIKAKILARIKFVTAEQARDSIPLKSAPKHVGGDAGGNGDAVEWVKERLSNFPVPEL